MGDFVWFVIIGIMFVLLGILFVRIGLQIWKKHRMDLIISHHCDKVSEENKEAYCKLAGIGVFMIGLGFLLTGVCAPVLESLAVLISMLLGLVLGIALLAAAVVKYNR